MSNILPWTRRSKEFFLKAVNHPVNASLLRFLEAESTPKALARTSPWHKKAYVIHVHPELGILLDDAAEQLPEHYAEFLFGFDVVANSQGIVCAFAKSMHTLAFRLPQYLKTRALQSGGQPIVDVSEDWMEFNPWDPGQSTINDRERLEIFRRWCELAYQYADELSIEEKEA